MDIELEEEAVFVDVETGLKETAFSIRIGDSDLETKLADLATSLLETALDPAPKAQDETMGDVDSYKATHSPNQHSIVADIESEEEAVFIDVETGLKETTSSVTIGDGNLDSPII